MRLYTSMHAVKAVTAFIVMPATTCGGLLELYLGGHVSLTEDTDSFFR